MGYRFEDMEAQRLAVLERSLAPNPSQSFNERTITRGMAIMFVPGTQIQRQVQPPAPQVLFPARYGFEQRVPSIEDVIDVDQMSPKRRQWMNGGARPTVPRQTFFDDTWADYSGISPNRYSGAML